MPTFLGSSAYRNTIYGCSLLCDLCDFYKNQVKMLVDICPSHSLNHAMIILKLPFGWSKSKYILKFMMVKLYLHLKGRPQFTKLAAFHILESLSASISFTKPAPFPPCFLLRFSFAVISQSISFFSEEEEKINLCQLCLELFIVVMIHHDITITITIKIIKQNRTQQN